MMALPNDIPHWHFIRHNILKWKEILCGAFIFSIKEKINVNEQDYLHIATEDLEHLH